MAKPPRSKPAAKPKGPTKANKVLGEDEIVLDGATYVLRPSHQALVLIEQQTGHAIMALIQMAALGELKLETLGIIAAEMIRAGASDDDEATKHVSDERIAELIMEAGIPHVAATLVVVLTDAATGGRTASGERKATSAPNR